MTDPSIAISSSSFSPATATTPVPNRPIAARTRLLLEGPVLSTLLRLSAPNVLNLLAIGGMITSTACSSAGSERMRSRVYPWLSRS
jgi:hypothetical protein